MKRVWLSLLALACVVSLAVAVEVTSENVAGAVRITVPDKNELVLVGTSMLPVGGANPTLADIFGTGQLASSTLIAQCDRVFLWNEGDQSYQIFAQKPTGDFYLTSDWGGDPTNPVVALGTAMWVKSAGASHPVTLLGEAPTEDDYTTGVAGNAGKPFFFLSNPYPTAADVQGLINTNDGAKASFLIAQADRMFLWNTATQSYLVLALKDDNQWRDVNDWDGDPVDIDLGVAEGFLFKSSMNFDWVEPRPYAWPLP
ncbi:MAG: hypothetical protein JW951_06470 [Lentisphaerae bacterium]|nr:hypothetical protein [Lentisphaerota bacterium]